MATIARNQLLTFNFFGTQGVSDSSIVTSRTDLNKKLFADSMLATMASERWSNQCNDSSGLQVMLILIRCSVITSNALTLYVLTLRLSQTTLACSQVDTSCIRGWSSKSADVLKQLLDQPAVDSLTVNLPQDVEFSDVFNMMDYFGIACDPNILTVTGRGAQQTRANVFLSNRKHVSSALESTMNTLTTSAQSSFKFTALSVLDDLPYINKSQPETLLPLGSARCAEFGNDERIAHFEWTKRRNLREAVVNYLEDEGFKARWIEEVVELAGTRDTQHSVEDIDTVFADRWALSVKVPIVDEEEEEPEKPAHKRMRVLEPFGGEQQPRML